ncbi:hypothetical protein ACP70R_009966 [Stipagrostis hirtigluma subsp. patula]
MADVPATHHAHATATAVPATVVAAAAVSIGAFACASTLLAYYATFAASLVCLARAVSPERVDEFLAHLRRTAQLARDAAASVWTDVEADLRRLRDAARGSPVVAPVYARAEERARVALAAVAGWADALKSWAAASWTEHKEAAHAAQFLLRLVAAVINLAATALFTAAYEEAKIRAPAVLRYLRGLIRDIRPPPPLPCKKTEEAALSSGFDCLDVIVPYLLCSMDLVFNSNAKGPMQIVVVTFVTSLGLTILFKELFYAPGDSDETDTTDDVLDEADTSRREVAAAADDGEAEAGRTVDQKMRESWDYLWLQIIVAYGIDAFLLRIMVGPRLVALALLARFNLEVLKVCRRIQLTPDDGEGAKKGSEGADKWRSAVMAVLVASGAKVLAIYLVLGFHLAAHSFASLCLVGASLALQEASLSDLDAPEEDDSWEEGAGLADDVIGGAEESEEVSAEHSNRSTDEGIIGDAKEGSATEQHCNISEERAEEQLEEEEPDNSSSSSSMDDNGWDLVEVDPEMPIDGDRGADRKRSTVFPWKYVA